MIQSRCEVLSSRRGGAFVSMTLVAPEIAERARPGQFIQVAMPEERSSLLRRAFFVHQTSRRGGWAGTLEFVVDPRGPGTGWLADVKPHQFLDVMGPLGRPFSIPRKPVSCLLVMEDYGAAPLLFLAEELLAQGQRVDMILGATSQDRILKPIEAKRLSRINSIVTADGSAGEAGHVVDVLEGIVARCGSEVVYAAGPRPLLRQVAEFCRERGIPAQVAVEETMACGTGVCWGCVVPVARRDGKSYDHLRACVEGPAMNAARILWDRWGTSEPAPTPPEGFPPVAADGMLPTPPHGYPAIPSPAGSSS